MHMTTHRVVNIHVLYKKVYCGFRWRLRCCHVGYHLTAMHLPTLLALEAVHYGNKTIYGFYSCASGVPVYIRKVRCSRLQFYPAYQSRPYPDEHRLQAIFKDQEQSM
eukprot:SAG31_NODE_4805_length_2945_cov_16.344694_4_plen_107_part_00